MISGDCSFLKNAKQFYDICVYIGFRAVARKGPGGGGVPPSFFLNFCGYYRFSWKAVVTDHVMSGKNVLLNNSYHG